MAADAKDVKTQGMRRGVPVPSLTFEVQQRSTYDGGRLGGWGSRLSPDWVECLMGLPVGWTLPTGPRLDIDPSPAIVRGRYPKSWDRTVHWPGYDWEPERTLPDGPPCRGRPARLRALGNAVCPQQGAFGLQTALGLHSPTLVEE